MTLNDVMISIDRLTSKKPHVLVAIDGNCASGKTTLAQKLGDMFHAPVIHMDDFFLRPEQRTPLRLAQPGGNIDAERFLSEVLTPLAQAKAFSYRPYDCHSQTLMPPVAVGVRPLTFIEGAYSLHPMLAHAYDLRILMTVDPKIQRERILRRNGSDMLERFVSLWIPMENRYFEETDIQKRCDILLTADADPRCASPI